jgi:hypothetical protein
VRCVVCTIFLLSAAVSIAQITFATNELSAISPSFPRQEIKDDSNDWFLSPTLQDREKYSRVQEENVTAGIIDDALYTFPDISSVATTVMEIPSILLFGYLPTDTSCK